MFTPRQIYSWEEAPVPIDYETVWIPEPVSTYSRRWKSLFTTEIPSLDLPSLSTLSIPTQLFLLA